MTDVIFENLFVLELANNHWGKLDRGLKIIRDITLVETIADSSELFPARTCCFSLTGNQFTQRHSQVSMPRLPLRIVQF